MKVLIFPTASAAHEKVAEVLLARIRHTPSSVLGLATGGTMEPVYALLRGRGGEIDVSNISTFNLDEYVGLAPQHAQSYHRYMSKHIFDHLNFDRTKTHIPAGSVDDPEAEADRYEQLILDKGGIDLQLLGIGQNGHIGFNEPGSSLGSRTRIKTLTCATRQANSRFFDDPDDVPRFAITVGIQTILDAREIIVLATGATKASACHQMIEGAISSYWPASALQLHPKVTAVLDEDAASELELRAYLESVHPSGQEVDVI